MSARAAQLRRPASGPASELRVVRRRGRSLIKRSGSRRTAPWFIVAVITVGSLVAGVLLEQVVLAQSAFKLQAIDKRLTQAETRQEELLATIAELESPGRIERYARTALGMVDPGSIEYIVARVRTGTDNRIADALNAEQLPLPGAGAAVGTSP